MQEEKKCPHGGAVEVKKGKELLNTAFNDTVKNLWRKSAASFTCWQEKNGENHCLHSCTNEQLVDLLTHLILCHANSSPYHWQPNGIICALKDKVEEIQMLAGAFPKKA